MTDTGAPAQLDAIAAELGALGPADFTAARNARAAASDPLLARGVKGLRKPSVAAWTVTLLAREGRLGEALELAAALREAQDDLDAAELARLGRQRRALVTVLAAAAVGLAGERGVAVGAAVREDIEQTINAAVTDAAAAAAVMSGRLVRGLRADGFGAGDVDVADAVNGTPVSGSAAAESGTGHRTDDLAARRARRDAERAARDAERAATEAERVRARAASRVETARSRADHAHERLAEVRAELARLEREAASADTELARLEDDERAAAAVSAQARRTAEVAARAVLDSE